jgi:hypothetical protein
MAEQDHETKWQMEGAAPSRSRRIAPLNVPLVIIADDPLLLDVASAFVAGWPGGTPESGRWITLELRLGADAACDVGCRAIVEGSRLTLDGPGIAGLSDARSGRAWAVVPAGIARDPHRLAATVLEPLLLFLLARSGRTPIHASGVVISGAAFAICGPSGSGKSSLALAAARRGLGVLSEDTLYVQTAPKLRIWGMPGPVHLLEGDAPADEFATRERAGKIKAIVPLADAGVQRSCAERAIPVILRRGDIASLEPIAPEVALQHMMTLDAGFDLLRTESERAFLALLASGAWRLTLSRDPTEAIDCLVEHFAGPG